MMLDMRRTFDEMVHAHSTPERAEEILANPFYQAISTSFSGTQEYMAMEKLGQLAGDRRVGPDRRRHPAVPVGAGLPGRAAAAVVLPGRPDDPAALGAGPGRRPGLLKIVGAGFGLFAKAVTTILGGQMLRRRLGVRAGVRDHVRRLPGARQATYELLRSPGTAFVVVAAPEPDALREASYFADRLRRADAAGRAGAQPDAPGAGRPVRDARPGTPPTTLRGRRRWPRRCCGCTPTGWTVAEPGGAAARPVHQRPPDGAGDEVPALAGDVADLAGLREIGDRLAA